MALARAVEAKDSYTEAHTLGVALTLASWENGCKCQAKRGPL